MNEAVGDGRPPDDAVEDTADWLPKKADSREQHARGPYVHRPQEPIGPDDPGIWSVAGPPVDSDLVFDWLEVHVNSKTRQSIDEIRLGTTWASVTAPWAGPPGARNDAKP